MIVAPGGGVWDNLIYTLSTTEGDLDVAVGVSLDIPGGTDNDGTAVVLTLQALDEGTTQVIFRPNPESDPELVQTTLLTDEAGHAIFPARFDSQDIVIDGTPPAVSALTAIQSGTDVLNCASSTLQGTVNISVEAGDALAGLVGVPALTVSQGGEFLAVTYVDESPAGTFNYTVEIISGTANGTWDIEATATDKAGNEASVSGTLCVDKNQIIGTVTMQTLSSTVYTFDREVVFKATDGSGSVLKTWTMNLHFANDPDPDGEVTTSDGAASASFVLTEVPSDIAGLSAKTAWSLRKKMAVALDGQGQGGGIVALVGGDLDNSNAINVLDYSLLKTNWGSNLRGDINGDGNTWTLDYALMKAHWFTVGDSE